MANLEVDYGQPFDYADGDVYLRSVDGVYFRVHKIFLSVASTTLRELFASAATGTQRDGLPIVSFLATDEGKPEIAAFLRIIYPVDFPSSEDLPLLFRVLDMARRYQADFVRSYLEGVLLLHPDLKEQPLSFYALSCTHRLEKLARASALEFAMREFDSLPEVHQQLENFHLLGGADMHRLVEYRHRVRQAVALASQLSNPENNVLEDVVFHYEKYEIKRPAAFLQYHHKTKGGCRMDPELSAGLFEEEDWHPREWWTTYLDSCTKALRAHPRPTLVSTPKMVAEPLLMANRCPLCREHATEDLLWFAERYREHIEGSLARVSSVVLFGFVSQRRLIRLAALGRTGILTSGASAH
jgi:hypothetical protein